MNFSMKLCISFDNYLRENLALHDVTQKQCCVRQKVLEHVKPLVYGRQSISRILIMVVISYDPLIFDI